MLSKAFEWCRITNTKPTSQMVDSRKLAVHKILASIDNAKNRELTLDCATGVVAGFEKNFTSTSPVVKMLVDAIREYESAFPHDILENALELRACAGIALGEILIRNSDVPSDDALLVASALRSGLGTRPSPNEKHLKQSLDELDTAAATVLAIGAHAKRQRFNTLPHLFNELEAQAPDDSRDIAVKPLKRALEELAQQSVIDREEINILWWMFAGPSTATGQPIAELPVGAAVLCCGAELGNRCLLPALPSHESMVRRAYEVGRKPQDLGERSLEKIVVEWDIQIMNSIVPDESALARARRYPTLLPISWLCNRLLAFRGQTGWPDEFEHFTGIQASYTRSPANWAVQAFRERAVHRMFEG